MGFILVVLALIGGALVVSAAFGAVGQYHQEVNDPAVVYQLGRSCARRGKDSAARTYFQRAAQMGHPGGDYGLGLMYAAGRGVPQNLGEAFRRIQYAAAQGLAEAQHALAEMYHEGTGTEVDLTGAYHYYRLAADQGHEPAVEQAKKFEGVASNPREAYGYTDEELQATRGAVCTHYHNLATIEGFERAVEYGDREAALNLSLMYLKDGNGSRAFEWMQTAAQMGNKMAKLVVRLMRPENNPAKEHLRELFTLFEAAKAGDPTKQYEVGRRFLDGTEVDADPTEAAFWFLWSYKHPPSLAALASIPREHWPEYARDMELSELA